MKETTKTGTKKAEDKRMDKRDQVIEFLSGVTTCKPCDWDDTKKIDYECLDKDAQQVIWELPRLASNLHPAALVSINATHYMIEFTGGKKKRYFFVNSEGHDYPRYMVEIINFTK